MTLLRIMVGLAVAAIGLIAALVLLFVGIAAFQTAQGFVAQVGSVVIFALIEGIIFFGAFYAFRKVMGPTPRDDDEA